MSLDWASVVKQATPAIVELRVNHVIPFDRHGTGCSVGTGFVVDKERGIILTNRHIVTIAPVTATAVFSNKKRVDVVPVYRDPVHDFGFFKFNPSDVADYPELSEIKLAPEEAKVGTDFRIIGSGEREQNSIVPGTLASITRKAPRYRDYMDFNTFYFSAVSNSKQGSSGSPVLNSFGHAIALNAGGSSRGAASFFLPLDRVQYALQAIQNGVHVDRRSILAVFEHKTFDEVADLGLPKTVEADLRKAFKEANGCLVVKEIAPGGPADLKGVVPGDILVSVQGELLHQFLPLQRALDGEAGNTSVSLRLYRNGNEIKIDVELDSLDDWMPHELVTLGGAVISEYGFIDCFTRHIKPKEGVLVSNAGYYMFRHAGINDMAIITSVKGNPVKCLDDLVKVFTECKDKENIIVKFFYNKSNILSRVVKVDKKWFPFQRSERNDVSGKWDFRKVEERSSSDLDKATDGVLDLSLHERELNGLKSMDMFDSIVLVENRAPYAIEGARISRTSGVGIIVDMKEGLVVTSRKVIFSHIGDIEISIGSLLKIDAELVYLHPSFNLALIKFDPKMLLNKQVKIAEIQFSNTATMPGDSLRFVGATSKEEKVQQNCSVTGIERPYFSPAHVRHFLSRNEEFLLIDQVITLYQTSGGIFLHESQETVSAFWLSFFSPSSDDSDGLYNAVPAELVKTFVDFAKTSASLHVDTPFASLGVSTASVPIGTVREALQLPDEWVKQLVECDSRELKQVLMVRSTVDGRGDDLRPNDFILAVNNKAVANPFDFETRLVNSKVEDEVEVDIVRDEKILKLKLKPKMMKSFETKKIVKVNGMIMHDMHDAIRFTGTLPEEFYNGGVFLNGIHSGSPANRGKFYSGCFVSKVGGVSTPNIEVLLEEIMKTGDGEYVNYELVSLNGKKSVVALKNDFHYFAPSQLVYKRDKWVLEELL